LLQSEEGAEVAADMQTGAEFMHENIPAEGLDPVPYVPKALGAGLVNERDNIPPSSQTGALLIDPALINTSGGTQARAQLDEPTVAEYSQQMLDGEQFP